MRNSNGSLTFRFFTIIKFESACLEQTKVTVLTSEKLVSDMDVFNLKTKVTIT
jgi:hypothetical protein